VSSFNIGKYEVTQAQWVAIMGNNPSAFKGDNLPVEQVSWSDVQEFIRRLNTKTGKQYRLPTEAEWEYAARGGNKSSGYKYSGGDNIDAVAWYGGNSGSSTHAVGTKQANELGIYDMSGNVWEWCSDWYGAYSASSQQNPKGASSGSDHVSRGGGWANNASDCRVSYRNSSSSGSSSIGLGFRLVLQNSDNNQATQESIKISDASPADNNTTSHFTEPEMVFVQGGTFTMGCTSEQGSDCYDKEKPAHKVTVSSFNIGKYEVTQAQWVAIMGNNPSRFKGDNLPVETVSWNDVQEFIRRLNTKTGKQYRLPTEAEWEYAARGGNKSGGYKYSGGNNIGNVAWYGSNSGRTTHAVGIKQANELGIYDMTGNVWEWCSDCYGGGSYHVDRGGSWSDSASNCRVSGRINLSPGYSRSNLGFRLVVP
jgi:formylglycine-generating enzyme required for sulfatase activity